MHPPLYETLLYHTHSRALCGNTYPDEVCRGNYSLHKHDPPLLFDLHSDPSEVYPLDTTDFEYAQLLVLIEEVRSCRFHTVNGWVFIQSPDLSGVLHSLNLHEYYSAPRWIPVHVLLA